ncbi:Hypothetical predicted protein [Pelobates cultripes]|uniref:Uncharacterized protein n=1 Tax=Pelobates cultripes TaxID=61616 RepID=A0AAD1T7X9_PELCU|nr:Hypothetical predicted protein [Pelobates cultripes]
MAVWHLKRPAQADLDPTSTVAQTLKTWDSIRGAPHLSPTLSPLIRMQHNPHIGSGLPPPSWEFIGGGDSLPIRKLLNNMGMTPLLELTECNPPSSLQTFRYAQIKYFYHQLPNRDALHHDLTWFEGLCNGTTNLIYQHLLVGHLESKDPFPPVLGTYSEQVVHCGSLGEDTHTTRQMFLEFQYQETNYKFLMF